MTDISTAFEQCIWTVHLAGGGGRSGGLPEIKDQHSHLGQEEVLLIGLLPLSNVLTMSHPFSLYIYIWLHNCEMLIATEVKQLKDSNKRLGEENSELRRRLDRVQDENISLRRTADECEVSILYPDIVHPNCWMMLHQITIVILICIVLIH